jgi:SAM-dependent methyltransferase
MDRFEPDARGPEDQFIDRLLKWAPGERWLDAGCGRRTFPPWRSESENDLVASGAGLFGCDADLQALPDREDAALVCGANLESLPFADQSFALVASNMVFEHLADPGSCIAELVRVTRPGGRILIHTVNARHYVPLLTRITPHRFHVWIVSCIEERAAEGVYPTVYRANTAERLSDLFESRGGSYVWGGPVTALPTCVPYPGLFGLGFGIGLLERRLVRAWPASARVLAPNLLMEFRRV